MAEDSEQEQSPKLDQSRIMVVGLVLVLLTIGITIGTTSGGTGDIQQFEQGQTSCTMTTTSYCSIVVTYPRAFPSVPNHVGATWAGLDQNTGHIETDFVQVGSYSIQADAGETWLNVPAATTEIYNLPANHRIIMNFASTTFIDFGLTCLGTTSATDTASFRLQFSNDGGSTWTELANAAGGGDITNVGLFCGVFAMSDALINAQFPIKQAAQTADVLIRVVGFGGAGVGDNVAISQLYVNIYKTLIETPSFCILDNNLPALHSCQPFSQSDQARTATSMKIWVMVPFLTTSSYPIDINWYAYLCINGGSAC